VLPVNDGLEFADAELEQVGRLVVGSLLLFEGGFLQVLVYRGRRLLRRELVDFEILLSRPVVQFLLHNTKLLE